jgi:abhydrolase domain-containing protein 13
MIRQPEPNAVPTVVFFQANAGNMGFRLPSLAQLYRAARVNLFICSYRGYGDSEGVPSEAGLMLDADAVLHVTSFCFVGNAFVWLKIVVFGAKLGFFG